MSAPRADATDAFELRIKTSHTLDEITAAVRQALIPLLIYDVNTDNFRPVTQGDIDQLSAVASAYAKVRAEMNAAHDALVKKWKERSDVAS